MTRMEDQKLLLAKEAEIGRILEKTGRVPLEATGLRIGDGNKGVTGPPTTPTTCTHLPAAQENISTDRNTVRLYETPVGISGIRHHGMTSTYSLICIHIRCGSVFLHDMLASSVLMLLGSPAPCIL